MNTNGHAYRPLAVETPEAKTIRDQHAEIEGLRELLRSHDALFIAYSERLAAECQRSRRLTMLLVATMLAPFVVAIVLWGLG